MKPFPECYACFLRQAHIASKLATKDICMQLRVQKEIARFLSTTDFSHNPPYIATLLFRRTYKVLGSGDPYLAVKKKYNRTVKALFPYLRALLQKSGDPFATAVRLALAGNIIDFGILEEFDLHGTLAETLQVPIPREKIDRIRGKAEKAKRILYLADNAGEIGFDAFLIDELRRLAPCADIVLAVKGTPVINDATPADARYFGLHKKARLADTGGNWVGTHPRQSSPSFQKLFNNADFIISKGQANWESLEELNDRRITFLLKAKCPLVARALNVRLNEIVLQ